MKMYELSAGTGIKVIDEDMLLHVDYRNWKLTHATRDSYFDNSDFIDYVSVHNNRKDSFPELLKGMIRADKNLVILRTFHKGKVYYAQASKYQLNYIG